MASGLFPILVRFTRAGAGILGSLAVATGLAACGGGAGAAGTVSGANADCSGVSAAHHARVVYESSPGTIESRCVGFSTSTISARTLLSDSKIELGTQQYSFGVAICQVAEVPAHYSQCLPSGKPYWALFVSHGGGAWTNPPVGISDITLKPGDSLGLRYDSPNGTPAPPPRTTKA